jgi:uncharacterized membrane protein
MNEKELSHYVDGALQSARTREQIYQDLLSKGMTLDEINRAFAAGNAAANNSAKLSVESKDGLAQKLITLFLAIGGILIVAGIFSFVASNWEGMSSTVKVIVIVASMLVAYMGGWYLREQKGYVKSGEALIVVGALIYGAGIFLIAQIFNVRIEWPDGFLFWFLGVLALGYAIESMVLLGLALPIAIIMFFGSFSLITSFLGVTTMSQISLWVLLIAALTSLFAGKGIRSRLSQEIRNIF